jgi:hypothetical protein
MYTPTERERERERGERIDIWYLFFLYNDTSSVELVPTL